MSTSGRTPSHNLSRQVHYGPVSGGGAAHRGRGFEAVMGTRDTQSVEDMGVCTGGGGG